MATSTKPQLICRRGLHTGAILILALRQLRRAGASEEDVTKTAAEVRAATSRLEALAALGKYVDVTLR